MQVISLTYHLITYCNGSKRVWKKKNVDFMGKKEFCLNAVNFNCCQMNVQFLKEKLATEQERMVGLV